MPPLALAVHRIKEFTVALGLLQFANQEFDRICCAHRVQNPPQDIGFLQVGFFNQQIFFACARFQNVHSREHTFIRHFAIQHDFAVTSAFELFKNHFIHPAAGINQRCGDNRQAAALFDVPRSPEKPLWALQCVGIKIGRASCRERVLMPV